MVGETSDHAHHRSPSRRGSYATRSLCRNLQINQPNLASLESMPLKLGVSAPDDIARADQEAHGLRTFIHSLVGLDRKAACRAFGRFIADTTASANQLDFMNMTINELT